MDSSKMGLHDVELGDYSANNSPISTRPGMFSEEELEKLGRQRPPAFPSVWKEVAFGFALLGSMLLAEYFISGFTLIIPSLTKKLDFPEGGEIWPSSVFSLVTGALLLPFGRLGDMYGGHTVFFYGLAWFFLWSLIAGFSQTYLMLVLCRALQGFGPAAFLPSGIMLVGSIYRPGPRKNIIFSLYGAFAPLGFFSGILVSGIADYYLVWNWYFYIGAIFLFFVTIAAFFSVPRDPPSKYYQNVRMDWWGVATIVPGLVLVVFAITYSAHAPQRWNTSYIPATLTLGVCLLFAAVYIEGWVAEHPLLPFDMFQVKGMKPLTVALFVLYGVFGIFLFYSTMYMSNVLGKTTLETSIWFIPMCAGGLVLATVGGFILHLLHGSILLAISGIGFIMTVLLFAILPDNPSYWAYIFPAMLCATIGIDITYNVTNVFITTNMPKHRQGLAGAFINTLVFLGIAFWLGIADIAVAYTKDMGEKQSYKIAFWLSVGLSGAAVSLLLLCVRVPRAKSELTVDEKEELERSLVEGR